MARVQQMKIAKVEDSAFFIEGSVEKSRKRFGELGGAFIMASGGGVYFMFERGKMAVTFPVLEDGRISNCSDSNVTFYPSDLVYVLDYKCPSENLLNRMNHM